MRPINKWPWPTDNGVKRSYSPHTKAKIDLEKNLGCYCSYCEVFSSDLEIEHIVSQHLNNTLTNDWDNFLLSCGRCNGKDNKSDKDVNFNDLHMPHLNNTYISLNYKEGGFVEVNPYLTGESLRKANNLINLVCLDKRPGNTNYPNFKLNDSRWDHRRVAWEYASKYLKEYEDNNLTAIQVVDFALQRGFFSVWLTVFFNHVALKKLLIEKFKGTSASCFDSNNDYLPVNRNPQSINDPI